MSFWWISLEKETQKGKYRNREMQKCENRKIEKCKVESRIIDVNKKCYFYLYNLIEKIIYRYKNNDYFFGFSNAPYFFVYFSTLYFCIFFVFYFFSISAFFKFSISLFLYFCILAFLNFSIFLFSLPSSLLWKNKFLKHVFLNYDTPPPSPYPRKQRKCLF